MVYDIRGKIVESANNIANVSHLERLVQQASELMVFSLKNGGKILVCGNGGSAAEAQHFSAELVGRFEAERKGIASIALSTDTSAITALGNDYGFDFVFKRQVESLGNKGDILLCLSTSGNSKNVLEAISEAKNKGMKIISLLGKDGGRMKGLGDVDIIINHSNTARIQEAHLLILHILAGIIEGAFKEK